MNTKSLQPFADRPNLYHATRALFESDLAIPLKRVTELPIPLPDLLGGNYRDKLHKTINKAYFAGIVDDEAFAAPGNDVAPAPDSAESAAEAARDQTAEKDYDGLVIFALDLRTPENNLAPTRSNLAAITRSFNRSFHGSPVVVLFRYKAEGSDYISLATCERTPYKQQWREGEKPGKVSLLRDIRIDQPHAGHLRILNDLRIPRTGKKAISTFDALYQHWQKKLDLSILNKTFYHEIAQFFYKLTGGKIQQGSKTQKFERQLRLPSVSSDDAQTYQEFAVRLIGRLIFCWFLKHKSSSTGEPLLPPDLLSADRVAENRKFYHSVLEKLFFEILNTPQKQRKARTLPDADRIPFLNGGLFEPHDKDFFLPAFINVLEIPDEWFSDLFTTLTGYVFTISENTPLDEEVAVDPEILGRIFENLLAEINPETGDTARKKTGSYYTPREIVDYMVTQSLVYCLNEKTGIDQDSLSKLMSHDDDDIELSDSQRDALIKALDTIKVLDPACGSGAFPMGILQRILLILQRIDTKSKRWLELKLARIENKMLRDQVAERLKHENYDYIHKLGIIQNSIFGIDIQPVAVEISKLRFFLSLIVDEKLDDTRPNRGVEPLPNLEFKFVAANTLIGAPDEYNEGDQGIGLQDPFFDKFETLTKNYFSENSPQRKAELREEIESLINGKAMEKYRHIQQITENMRHQQDGTSKKKREAVIKKHSHELKLWQSYPNIFRDAAVEFFDIKYFFPDAADGFDIVIGNPPYVRQESIIEQKPFLSTSCTETFTSTADLYVYFYDRGLQFLHKGGILTFISSNKYFRAGYGKKLRKHLVENTALQEIIDFGDAPVFTAIAYPAIVIARKQETQGAPENEFKALNWKPGEPIAQFAHVFARQAFTISQAGMTPDGWRFEQPEVLHLLDKMRNTGTPLGEYVNGRFYRGILTGYNKAFVIDKPTRDRLIEEDPKSAEVIKPFLRGRDVKRWRVNFAEQYLIFIPWHFPLHEDSTIVGASEKAEEEFRRLYPAIHGHLSQYKERLVNRNKAETGIRYEWYALQRCAATYWQELAHDKVVLPSIDNKPNFAYDDAGMFGNDKTSVCVSSNVKYLVGILNSPAIWWYLRQIAASRQGGFYELNPCM